jgi:hypothetical protein
MHSNDELLTENNFLLYAAKYYQTRLCCGEEEFKDDLNRIRYIKKLLTRYEQSGDLKERLILNHLIVLTNMFGPYHCSRIIFLKFQDQFELIKPFLAFIYILPLRYHNIGAMGTTYTTTHYMSDPAIEEKLKSL